MRRILWFIFIYIISLVMITHGVVLTGTVKSINSQISIPNASITFRLGREVALYPVAFTDSNGFFKTELSLEQNYTLQYCVEKENYVTNISYAKIVGDSIDLGIITLDSLVVRQISFCGIIIDSVSGLPVSGVLMRFWKHINDVNPFLEFTTDSTGRFFRQMTLSNALDGRITWKAYKTSYYLSAGSIKVEMDSAQQCIRLRPLGSILVRVNGKVIDSVTGKPIDKAFVSLRTNYHDAAIDTCRTDSDGNFSRSVQKGVSTSSMPVVDYVISAPGYTLKRGVRILSSDTVSFVDLSELKLSSTIISNERVHKTENCDVQNPIITSQTNNCQTLSFNLCKTDWVSVDVYTISGRKIVTLFNSRLDAGSHDIQWNTQNIANGTYIARIKVGSIVYMKSMLVF